jgi:hypothetical protein
MNLSHALLHARALNQRDQPFELSFVKASGSGRAARRTIERCILRKADPKDSNRAFKLYLFDADTMENRTCWIPLITSIDNQKVTIE